MPYVQIDNSGKVTSLILQEDLELDETYIPVDLVNIPVDLGELLDYSFINGVFTKLWTASVEPTAQEILNSESQAYLDSTDKFFTRFSETGKAMPEGMSEARAAARESIVGEVS